MVRLNRTWDVLLPHKVGAEDMKALGSVYKGDGTVA